MKLKFGTFVLLCVVWLAAEAVYAATDDAEGDNQHFDAAIGQAMKIADVDVDAAVEVQEPLHQDNLEELPIASKDIPIEHDGKDGDDPEKEEEEQDDKEDDGKAFEEKQPAVDDAIKNAQFVIEAKDMEKFKEPSMQRLARQLSILRGRQIFHLNPVQHNALEQNDDAKPNDPDAIEEERAVRRRTRIRRRKTKDRLNPAQGSRVSSNRRRNNRRRNSMRRGNKSRYGAKRTQKRRFNKNGGNAKKGLRNGNRKNAKRTKSGKRRLNNRNGQRPNKRITQQRRRRNNNNKRRRNNKNRTSNQHNQDQAHNAMPPNEQQATGNLNAANPEQAAIAA